MAILERHPLDLVPVEVELGNPIKDRLRDHRLDCGPGSDYVRRDPFDPDPLRCRPPKQKPPS